MKLDYADLVRCRPSIRLADSIVPQKRLEVRVDMEKHILRFVVIRWGDGMITTKEHDSLHIAVDDYNGDLK